jgi:GH3 auxin-responsive promoter
VLKPALLHLLGQASRARYALEFGKAVDDPRAAQEAKLRELLQRNAGTDYGRLHGLAPNLTPREYSERIPFMTPASLEPWTNRLMSGERNLVSADAPIYYVRTTGSTGAAKHVPITPSYRAEFQRTVHVALWHLFWKFPAAFRGRALYFVGSRRVARAADGNDIGTMSGFNFTELPEIVRAVYAWPYELFEIADLRARSFLALYLACAGGTSLIGGVFPAPVVYLLRDLEERAAELARCFRDGTLPAGLEKFSVGRQPQIAARLERAANAPVEEKVREALPQLRLVYCWITSTAALYLPELQRRLGPRVAVRDAIYSACEGWCSIPIGDEEPGGPLAVTSHFFEFFEEGSAQPRYAWELEDGKRYSIVLTTGSGLYRYQLGDIVEVCGFHKETPRIRFVRKEGAASNLAGEKLDESHVNRAVGKALKAFALEATYFTLVPKPGRDRPGYELLLEAKGDVPAGFAALTDDALGEASYDYGRLRAGGQLLPLELRRLAKGTYDRVRQEKVRDGSAEAQLKIAHLIADPNSLPPALMG